MFIPVSQMIDRDRWRLLSRWPGRALAALLLTSLPLFAQYEAALQYQNRGNRHEGLKSKPVSGYDIELLSALVDWREPSPAWPETVHLRFYLPTAEPVFVTVRQPRPKTTYYWLDKVEPPSPWRAGAFNEFTWPSATVLRSLPSVTFDDLGAVVRLRQAEPSREELIAPAALFHAQPPAAVNAYRFTFKTNGAAHVAGAIYRDGQKVALYQRPQEREQPGSPFTLRWDAQGQPEGEYLLVLSGFFDNDNTPLLKRVTFYHRAAWR